MTKNDTMTI